MVLVLDTSSPLGFNGFQVIERTQFVTDRQMDGRTDRRTGKNNMSPDPEGGRHNYKGYVDFSDNFSA